MSQKQILFLVPPQVKFPDELETYMSRKCLIYSVKCKVSKKCQVGGPVNAFQVWWNIYKNNDKTFQRNDCYSQGHNEFFGNVSLSPADKTDGFQPKT